MSNLPILVERLATRYEHNPIIRALVQLIPFGFGSAADVALVTTIENIREERAHTFFDELASQDLILTEEQIENEDFLHSYFATTRAALNTRRREKIRLFARRFPTMLKVRYAIQQMPMKRHSPFLMTWVFENYKYCSS